MKSLRLDVSIYHCALLICICFLLSINVFATDTPSFIMANYDVYMGDVDGDGTSDFYFAEKPLIILLHGDIVTPIVIPPKIPNNMASYLKQGEYTLVGSLNLSQAAFASKNLKKAVANIDYFTWATGYMNKTAILLRGAKITDPSLLLSYVTGPDAQPIFPLKVKTFPIDPPESNMSDRSLSISMGSQYGDSILQIIVGGKYVQSADLNYVFQGVPTNPTLVFPANGAVLEYTDNPCFNWIRGYNSASNSSIILYKNSDMSGVRASHIEYSNQVTSVCWNSGFEGNPWPDYPLKTGVTYYWRVMVDNGNSTMRYSPLYSFTIKPKVVADSSADIRLAWSAVSSALKSNNRAELTQRFDPAAINKYNQVFDALGSQLAEVGNQLGDIEPLYVNENTAVYLVTKKGDNGGNYVHTIKFIKDANGTWKVNEL